MTTYHSQTCRTVDRDGNALTFGTLNEEGQDAVLQASVTVELPDGQQVNIGVLFEEADVCGLIGYLHDNFGRVSHARKAMQEYPYQSGDVLVLGPEVFISADGQVLSYQGRNYIPQASEEDNAPRDLQYYGEPDIAVWQPKSGDTVHVVTAEVTGHQAATVQPRQCPVIYDGAQCTAAEGHDFGHQFTIDWTTKQDTPQNDAGAATPPADAQGASNTPQPAATGQSAAESATGAGTPAAAPASQPAPVQKRKRRTKLEIAYDTAKEAYAVEQSESNYVALQSAYDALAAKDPGNSRVSGQGQAPAPETPAEIRQEIGGPSFAPEQPVHANYAQQAAHPINQEFATWANNLPGEHVGDSVLMTPEQAATVPAFAPGQTPQLGQVTVTPEEQQAANGFPCQEHSSDGRPCLRPYGHEIQTANNPDPKPHVYATLDPSQLGQPAPVTDPLPWTPPAQPTGPLSFQVPPTPDQVQPHPDLQPPAPAAPFWQQPV